MCGFNEKHDIPKVTDFVHVFYYQIPHPDLVTFQISVREEKENSLDTQNSYQDWTVTHLPESK